MNKVYKIVISGGVGFIGSYITKHLLEQGNEVHCFDNLVKYNNTDIPFLENDNFTLYKIDLTRETPPEIDADFIIHCAASVGGIGWFNKYFYQLYDTNEKIDSTIFDYALKLHKKGKLQRIVAMSSSMVYEGCDEFYAKTGIDIFPSKEHYTDFISMPKSSYGRSKLSTETRTHFFYRQYGLNYTIVRPFNAVGEEGECAHGKNEKHLTHVIPELCKKVLSGQNPLHILGSGNQVRNYTNAKDIAIAIGMILDNPVAINNIYNISSNRSTTVLELAELIWKEVNGDLPFSYVSDQPLEFDVQKRQPCTEKAKIELGFEAKIPLEQSVKECVEFIRGSL